VNPKAQDRNQRIEGAAICRPAVACNASAFFEGFADLEALHADYAVNPNRRQVPRIWRTYGFD
jgi:hypothetical protein